MCWGDCVKLNQDNEQLKELCCDYVVNMAKMFDGIRIDNAHSTNKDLLKSALTRARKVNPNLLVMLEVFTGSKEQDDHFCQDVGADLIVKEMIHCTTVD